MYLTQYIVCSGELHLHCWDNCTCTSDFRDVEIGDVVTVGECRPLSKTVRFNVLKVSKGTGTKKSFKKF
jgi:ribosomal protein S17